MVGKINRAWFIAAAKYLLDLISNKLVILQLLIIMPTAFIRFQYNSAKAKGTGV